MRVLLGIPFFAVLLAAQVADRVAVVVGDDVITQSELIRDVRLTEFLNGEAVDVSPAKLRSAAERLVDQQLIRNEMEFSRYPQPGPEEADKILAAYLRDHASDNATNGHFRETLARYGISLDELKQYLTWQAAALQFTESRFKTSSRPADTETANRSSNESETPAPPASVDQRMEAWLKDARANTRVKFIPEAFQ